MSEILGSLEKRLITTRDKIRNKRREITGGIVEDKIKDVGKNTYDELDRDLDGLQKAVKEGSAKAGGASKRLFEEIATDITAARTKLNEKRMDITGGYGEEKAKAAAHVIKEKSEAALKEIEEDISKLSEKLKRAQDEE
jgi:signal transduction histidine kinase